jgi:hypothetical protein
MSIPGEGRRLPGGGIMKYLCLIYFDERVLEAMPNEDMDRLMEEHAAFNLDIARSGHLLATDPLEPVRASTTLRVRNGKLSTTDGPFAETKEQLCGYYLIEARDLNEAIHVAARIPAASRGTIEVRPVRDTGR